MSTLFLFVGICRCFSKNCCLPLHRQPENGYEPDHGKAVEEGKADRARGLTRN